MKIELELPDKPEIHSIAATLNLDPDAVVGKLIRIWQWFDKHTTDGNAHGVTFSLPDRISGVTGFGEAMMFVGWLEQKDKYLVMPKFDSHTSASAKTRAQTAKRVAKHKENGNAKGNAPSVSEALPREEKRRSKQQAPSGAFDPTAHLSELGVSDQTITDFLALRKKKRAEVTLTAVNGLVSEAKKAGCSLEEALMACCKNGWQGFDASWMRGRDGQTKKQDGNFLERVGYG